MLVKGYGHGHYVNHFDINEKEYTVCPKSKVTISYCHVLTILSTIL